MAEGMIQEPSEVALHPRNDEMEDAGDGAGNLVMQDHSYSKSPYADVLPPIQNSPVRDKPQQLLSLIKDPEQLQALAAARQVDQKYFENIGKPLGFADSSLTTEATQPQIPSRSDKEKMDLDGFTEVSLMLQSAQFQLPKDLQSELDDGEHTDPYAHDELPQAPSPVPNKRKRKMSFKLRQSEEEEGPLNKKKLKKKKKFKLDGKKLTKEEKRAAKLERKKLKRQKKLMKSKAKKSLEAMKDSSTSETVNESPVDAEVEEPSPVNKSISKSTKRRVSNGLRAVRTQTGRRARSAVGKTTDTEESEVEKLIPKSRTTKSRAAATRPIAKNITSKRTRRAVKSKPPARNRRTRAAPAPKRKSEPIETTKSDVIAEKSKPAKKEETTKKQEATKKRMSYLAAGRTTRNSLSASEADLQKALKASAVEARKTGSRSLRSSGVQASSQNSPKNSAQVNEKPNRRATRSANKSSPVPTRRRNLRR